MKLTGDFQDWTVTQATMGRILSLTPGRISQLVDEKIITKDDGEKNAVFLVESMQNYYQAKQHFSDGRGKVNFWEERGLHERAKRKLAELKLKQAKGELYRAEAVDNIIFETIQTFRNKLLGLPAKLSKQLEGKNLAQINQILSDEIYENLNELANNLEGADFYDIEKEDGAGNTTSAENDDKSMGE